MENRTTLVRSIRPTIKVITEKSTPIEVFQSNSLRPILKLQNELILTIFNNYILDNKIQFIELKEDKKKEFIFHHFKNNQPSKIFYLGIIIGMFTTEEYTFYSTNKQEINKRITTMLIERLNSQLEKISL
ncbi:MAG: glyoxalase [Bacteroidia bacterium]|nr:glyoxalase [Bacteroidia bacterium]